MPAPKEVTHRDITSESTKLSATASVESDLLQALTSEQGFMRPGAMPAVSAASAAGSKALLDTLGKARGLKTLPISPNKIVHVRSFKKHLCSQPMTPLPAGSEEECSSKAQT